MVDAQILDNVSLTIATTSLSAILACLFIYRRIHRLYPFFFAFCIFDIALTLAPFATNNSKRIGQIELGAWMIQWLFYFLLILELVDKILSDHPGLARLGRRSFQFCMVIAALVAVISLKLDTDASLTISAMMRLFYQTERLVAGSLLIVLLFINAFVWYFPIRLSRNTKAYLWGFTLLFLVKAIVPFFLNTSGVGFLNSANVIHLAGMLLCQAIWVFAITKPGAGRTSAFISPWTPGQQQKVLSTLEAFEQNISGTPRH